MCLAKRHYPWLQQAEEVLSNYENLSVGSVAESGVRKGLTISCHKDLCALISILLKVNSEK